MRIQNDVELAAQALVAGNLVAFPTETVYGLGADATNEAAVNKIYLAKNRPTDHPLIVHISSSLGLSDWAAQVPQYALLLAERYWPGPMTLILKRSGLAKDFITGGQDSVGLRVPAHKKALELLEKFESLGGKGVAAPSANRFGGVSPTSAQAVLIELGDFLRDGDSVLDGGDCSIGIESTIIDCTRESPSILRPGFITEEMISETTGLNVQSPNQDLRVSGSMKKHYSPRATVVLDAKPEPGDGLIAMSDYETPEAVVRLCDPEDELQYAKQLYASLRKADELGLRKVVAILPKGSGLAAAIRDRLTKSAAQ